MGGTTGISWTDSTINVWHGCDKVSPGCKHCYAEVSTPVRVKRAAGLEVWGPKAARSETKGWERDLRKWQRQAAATNRMRAIDGQAPQPWRVFGQSLSDTFEERDGDWGEYLDRTRARFFAAIEAAPALTFQLLTKRPENIARMVPPSWLDHWPAHVWIGTTVEDQRRADERIPHLLQVPARVRFLSCEPLLEAVDLTRLTGKYDMRPPPHGNALTGSAIHRFSMAYRDHDGTAAKIHWVICGGESGPKARPFDLAWARSLRDQCRAAGCAYFFKQAGSHVVHDGFQPAGGWWPKGTEMAPIGNGQGWRVRLKDTHGANLSEIPADLHVREFPHAVR